MSTLVKQQIDIDSPYKLTEEQKDFYRKNEFIKLKNVLSEETLNHYKKFIWEKTLELNTNHLPMEERDTYSRAFIQVINIWQHCSKVCEFVMGKTLARIASELMDVEGVRLYHDQALFKEQKGGFTPWHADQQYWPLASDKTITVWIPLVPVTNEMGPLSFAAGSHKDTRFRDLAISDDSESIIQTAMDKYAFESSPFDLGEVSFHSGWMYHRAPANSSGKMRGVMTFIYMDKDMKLKKPENQNQINDRNAYCPGIEVGDLVNSELNPVIYSK
ncbi:MAG: phytanoyl-CoA dioxygenase family protein [Lentisphaeraceae bacterium]|nr:phytanoyl-CoA dioxygenase family protein [Lentisphaeraceae bacterium]